MWEPSRRSMYVVAAGTGINKSCRAADQGDGQHSEKVGRGPSDCNVHYSTVHSGASAPLIFPSRPGTKLIPGPHKR